MPRLRTPAPGSSQNRREYPGCPGRFRLGCLRHSALGFWLEPLNPQVFGTSPHWSTARLPPQALAVFHRLVSVGPGTPTNSLFAASALPGGPAIDAVVPTLVLTDQPGGSRGFCYISNQPMARGRNTCLKKRLTGLGDSPLCIPPTFVTMVMMTSVSSRKYM